MRIQTRTYHHYLMSDKEAETHISQKTVLICGFITSRNCRRWPFDYVSDPETGLERVVYFRFYRHVGLSMVLLGNIREKSEVDEGMSKP